MVLKAEDKVHSLTVRDVQVNEAGRVKLTAKDFQTAANLIVKGKKRSAGDRHQEGTTATGMCDFFVRSEPPVEFTKPLEDQTVEEEATATLECEVSRENADVLWLRDGQEIRKTKKYEMVIDGRKRALVIHDCTLDDSRTYTCGAKDFKTSCFLTVERK